MLKLLYLVKLHELGTTTPIIWAGKLFLPDLRRFENAPDFLVDLMLEKL